MIITRKIRITSDNKQFWEYIRDVQYKTFKAANIAMQALYYRDVVEGELLTKLQEASPSENVKEARKTVQKLLYKQDQGVFDRSKQNAAYQAISLDIQNPSYVKSSLADQVWKHYQADYKNVMSGNATQRTYKRNMPIPYTKSAFQDITEEGMTLAGLFEVVFLFGRDRQGNRSFIERIIDGTYTLCDSQIKLDGKKCFWLLCVRIPEQEKPLLESVEAIADISFLCPVLITASNQKGIITVGPTDEITHLRLQLNARYETLQGKLVTARGGHGRKRKLKAIDAFHELEKRAAKTVSHAISKRVVDEVLKTRAATLHIRTAPIPDDSEVKKFRLRFWGYHELASQIQYKAKKYGIKVVWKEKSE